MPSSPVSRGGVMRRACQRRCGRADLLVVVLSLIFLLGSIVTGNLHRKRRRGARWDDGDTHALVVGLTVASALALLLWVVYGGISWIRAPSRPIDFEPPTASAATPPATKRPEPTPAPPAMVKPAVSLEPIVPVAKPRLPEQSPPASKPAELTSPPLSESKMREVEKAIADARKLLASGSVAESRMRLAEARLALGELKRSCPEHPRVAAASRAAGDLMDDVDRVRDER